MPHRLPLRHARSATKQERYVPALVGFTCTASAALGTCGQRGQRSHPMVKLQRLTAKGVGELTGGRMRPRSG